MGKCKAGKLACVQMRQLALRASAVRAGVFGTVLPPAFYVPGASAASVSNASLTLSNMTLLYDHCNEDLWMPAALVISAQQQVAFSHRLARLPAPSLSDVSHMPG